MFDIGFWELSLIFIIALLVIGPERLPRVARDVGLWVGKIRRYVTHVRDDIEREINAQEIREMLEKPKELEELYDVVEETKGTLKEAKSTLDDAQAGASEWTRSIEKAEKASDPEHASDPEQGSGPDSDPESPPGPVSEPEPGAEPDPDSARQAPAPPHGMAAQASAASSALKGADSGAVSAEDGSDTPARPPSSETAA